MSRYSWQFSFGWLLAYLFPRQSSFLERLPSASMGWLQALLVYLPSAASGLKTREGNSVAMQAVI
ncbi:MAG: hypothetical protein AAF810_16380 [Cyanobacteria bacterium P01_D01_bin.36]